MSVTWIVVADRARARILTPRDEERKPLSQVIDLVGRAGYAGPEKLTAAKMNEEQDFVNPEGRMKNRELEEDRDGEFSLRGRSGQSAGVPHQTGDDQTEPDEQAAKEFAKDLVEYLEKSRQQNKFDKLGLVAAPKFLGELRSHLTGPLQKMVEFEMDKDYSKLKPEEIREHLPEKL